jgi:hypothetical protein
MDSSEALLRAANEPEAPEGPPGRWIDAELMQSPHEAVSDAHAEFAGQGDAGEARRGEILDLEFVVSRGRFGT